MFSRHLLTLLFCFILIQSGIAQSTRWINAETLGIEGQGWTDTEHPFDRLPARAKEMVRPPVWDLSRHSSGMCLHFQSNSSSIKVKYTNRFDAKMPHMSEVGIKGVDLYAKKDGQWFWAGASKTSLPTWEGTLIEGLPKEMREYRLYLPTYDGIDSLSLGIDSTAVLTSLKNQNTRGLLVFYGTSIMQGCSASRPGMVPSGILGRHLNYTTINLGFSGNGKLDPEMADLMGQLKASCYILDCTPNLPADEIEQKTLSFVKRLRALQPNIPIVLVGNTGDQKRFLLAGKQQLQEDKNKALRNAFDRLKKEKTKALFLVKNNDLIGVDGEGSIDGVHYTDVGFMRYAEIVKPVIRKALKHAK